MPKSSCAYKRNECMCLKIWPKPLRAYDGLKFLKNPKTILKINQMVSLKQGKYTNHTKKPV